MKKINLIAILSLVHLVTFAQSLEVQIKQNGKVIEAVAGVYELKKAPFQFEITATDLEGFLVGATTDEQLFETAIGDFNPEVYWFQSTGMSEELYNKDKELYLMDLAPSYWYYTDAQDHRFDKNPSGNIDHWTAKRTVTRFFDILINEAIALKNFDGSVYLLMYDPEYDEYYDLIGKNNLFQAKLHFTK